MLDLWCFYHIVFGLRKTGRIGSLTFDGCDIVSDYRIAPSMQAYVFHSSNKNDEYSNATLKVQVFLGRSVVPPVNHWLIYIV